MIDRAYGPQADMWSLGCVIYEMLTGYEAFPSLEGMERKDLYHNIKTAKYDKNRLTSLSISAEAQDLLSKILNPDPRERLSASEAMKHPWVSTRYCMTFIDHIIIIQPPLIPNPNPMSQLESNLILYYYQSGYW